MNLSLIVGVNKCNGIGYNGTMPWYFPEDLKYFQRITKKTTDTRKKNVVIMGRNTMNSIQRFPLGDRINVCISTTIVSHIDKSVLFYTSLDEAITDLTAMNNEIENIFVIGGSMLYEACLVRKDLKFLYINQLNDNSECDTFFPVINYNDYRLINGEQLSDNVITNVYEKL
jgi:dihydrofolate reductase